MKRRGFTLIELLAVILILGIISLIAIPMVNDMVKESKKDALINTVANVEREIEDSCNVERLKGNNITSVYNITNNSITPKVDIKGDLPSGKVYLDSDCNATYELKNDDYVVLKKDINSNARIITCEGDCSIYKDSVLNGADPVLDYNMIPVTIDNNGVVKKADIFSSWYDYSNKKWANSILVTKESRDKYLNISNGSVINNDDILGYFVWIPRYKYKISTSGTTVVSDIDIEFETKDKTISTGNAKTEYRTHPAFNFDGKELDGIWFAKFESSTDKNSSCYTNSSEENCKDVDPLILPNSNALVNQDIATEFKTSLKLRNDKYGVSSDSHMAKNNEWGAAAYLYQSKFGLKSNMYINANKKGITGCGASTADSAAVDTCINSYGSSSTYNQSTTGNISGIFDLKGGNFERVMANYNNLVSGSGFTSMPKPKYYDLYTTLNPTSACNGYCYGGALLETSGWYGQSATFIKSDYPWLYRGFHYGYGGSAGPFAYIMQDGSAYSIFSFRIVITPGV